jgi:hypothetical protein
VGEAFLSTLTVLNKYQASNKEVVAAYTKFYSLLLQSGFSSWEDYLLDQVRLKLRQLTKTVHAARHR